MHPWLLASSLADTPFSCSRQIETDEQPAVVSSTTNATTKLKRPIKVTHLLRAVTPRSRDELADNGDELRQLLRMPAGERRELLEPDLVGVVRQAFVDPR